MIVEKPWGFERIIEKNGTYVVKELVVNPGHRLSLQYHEKKTRNNDVGFWRCLATA